MSSLPTGEFENIPLESLSVSEPMGPEISNPPVPEIQYGTCFELFGELEGNLHDELQERINGEADWDQRDDTEMIADLAREESMIFGAREALRNGDTTRARGLFSAHYQEELLFEQVTQESIQAQRSPVETPRDAAENLRQLVTGYEEDTNFSDELAKRRLTTRKTLEELGMNTDAIKLLETITKLPHNQQFQEYLRIQRSLGRSNKAEVLSIEDRLAHLRRDFTRTEQEVTSLVTKPIEPVTDEIGAVDAEAASSESPGQNVDEFAEFHSQFSKLDFKNLPPAESEHFLAVKKALDEVYKGYDLKNLTEKQKNEIQYMLDDMFLKAYDKGKDGLSEEVSRELEKAVSEAKNRQEAIRGTLKEDETIDVGRIDALFADRNSILGNARNRENFLNVVALYRTNPRLVDQRIDDLNKLGFNIKKERQRNRAEFFLYFLAMATMGILQTTQSMTAEAQPQQ